MKAYFVPKGAAALAATVVLTLSASASAQELFVFQQGAFDTQACNGSGCWSNYLRVVDLNNDGYMDVVEPNYGGFFNLGNAQPLVIYYNDGNGQFTLGSNIAVDDFQGRLRQVAIGDVTGDGFVDIFAPDGGGGEGGMADALFINNGDGTFTDEADARIPDNPVYAGATRFGDLNGDGWLDIFIADGYAQGGATDPVGRILINDGTGVFSEGGSVPMGSTGIDPDDVDFIDFDRDFDLDVLINMHGGKSSLWQNDGAGNFTDVSDQWVNQPAQGYHYNPAVCDVDGDGDLDVWTDNMAPGYMEQLAINDGSGNFTDETADRVTDNMAGADDNGVACADVDGDGDFDAVIFNLFGGGPQDPRAERVLYNDGNGNFQGSELWDEFTLTSDNTLWGEGADLNDDGKLDWITAQGEQAGTIKFYAGDDNVPQDALPPVIIAGVEVSDPQTADAEPWLRFAISDEVVTDSGPPLDAAWVAYTVDGGAEQTVDAWFVGGDLFQASLPAQAAGSTVEYMYCARDRWDNETCGDPIQYTIEEEATDTTGDGDTGTTTGTTTGDGDTTGESGGDTSGTSGGNDDVGTDGTGDDAMADGGGDDGCNCSSESSTPAGGALGLLALFGLLGLRRRRG